MGDLLNHFRVDIFCFYGRFDFAFVWTENLDKLLTDFNIIALKHIRLRDQKAWEFLRWCAL